MDISTPGKPEGPVVVLMNGGTISAAEDFIDVMKTYTDLLLENKPSYSVGFDSRMIYNENRITFTVVLFRYAGME